MKKLGVVYGGKSAEHEVSLSTALAVTGAINYTNYEVYPIFITKNGEWRCGERLLSAPTSIEALLFKGDDTKADDVLPFLVNEQGERRHFDVILPLIHGTNGEDGTIQGFFEVLNMPYVGNGVLSSSASMDKHVMKQLFAHAGLPQLPYEAFIRIQWEQEQAAIIEKCEQRLGYPMYVKPANLGSSVGISKATTQEELIAGVKTALMYDRKIVIEQGVVAREIELAVLGNDKPKVSVPGEIKSTTDFYDYESKYHDNKTELVIPAELSETAYAQLQTYAIEAFKAVDGSGLIRADFFVTADERIYINEVNTLPGFTPMSMYPLLWQETGLPYPDLIDELIQLAIHRHEEKQQLQFKLK